MHASTRLYSRLIVATIGLLAGTSCASAKLLPQQVDDFFIQPDISQQLVLKSDDASLSQISFVLKDYAGKQMGEGSISVTDGRVAIPLQLSAGFYELVISQTKQSFGLMAIKPFSGKPDLFFGIDTALSWLELRSDIRDGLIRILKRSGIGMSRERLSLGAINPKPETWDWQTNRQYDALRKSYKDIGVPILDMCYGLQGHTARKGDFYPQNLIEFAKSWQTIATRFAPSWGAVEVWNEPDLNAVPADQYAPLAKVVAYANKQAKVSAPIVGGVFTGYAPGAYQEVCAENGMLQNVDAVSFHMYEDAPEIQPMIRQYRQLMKNFGYENMPLWLTECGRPWTIGPDRAPIEQDSKTALEIAMKAAECRANGFAGYYPFVYVFYEEAGAKNFGMMGREVSPMRSMAAYAFSVSMLAHKNYIGDLKENPSGLKISRAFENGSSRIIVLYTGSAETAKSIKLSFKTNQIFGADGRTLKSNADGTIPLPDGMGYVLADASAVDAHIKTDTPTATLLAVSRKLSPQRSEPSPIILQHVQKKLKSRVSSRRYLVDEVTARELTITANIQNLSDQAEIVTPTLSLPGIDGKPAQTFAHSAVEVAGRQSREISWTLDASAALDPTQMRFIRITATAAHGPAISPLAVPLVMEADLDKHLSRHEIKNPLPITQLDRWRKNNSDTGKCEFSSTDKTWSMDVDFGKSGVTWCYPRFILPQRMDPQTCTGVLLRARIQNPARNVAVMCFENGKATFWVNEAFPADGQWHSVFIPLDEFKPMPGHPDMQNAVFYPERIEDISVGMSTNGPTNRLEVSDLLLVGRKK